jgi:hypothetical protein
MAVTANPNGRALRQLAPGAALEPLVKPFGTAADESVRGPRHLEIANRSESLCPVARIYHFMPRAASHEKVRPEWTVAIGFFAGGAGDFQLLTRRKAPAIAEAFRVSE